MDRLVLARLTACVATDTTWSATVLVVAGVPADDVAETVAVFGAIPDGRNATATDGVRRALGRPPRDVTAYARTAAATGAWAVA